MQGKHLVLPALQITFLKLLKNEVGNLIYFLANISFNVSIFPNILKTANVTPIFKNDKPDLCSS